jgi:hypothetical protein
MLPRDRNGCHLGYRLERRLHDVQPGECAEDGDHHNQEKPHRTPRIDDDGNDHGRDP